MIGAVAAAILAALAATARADQPPPPSPAPLRVGVPDAPGPVSAFDRALFTEVGRETGLAVAFVSDASRTVLVDLDAGRIDVAAGPYAAGVVTPGRHALPPVLTDGDALLRRRGDGSVALPAAAADKRVGLLGPAADAPRLRAAAAALRARVVGQPGSFGDDPLRDLVAGRLAALFGAVPDVAAAVLARPDAVEAVGPPFGPTRRLAPVMRADRPDLAARIEAAFGRLRADGRLAELQRRWFGLAFDSPCPPAARPTPVGPSKP